VLCLPSVGAVLWVLTNPLPIISGTSTEETRDLIRETLLPNLARRDAVYVENGARPAFGFYVPAYRQLVLDNDVHILEDGDVRLLLGGVHYTAAELAAPELDASSQQLYAAELDAAARDRSGGRLWLLFSHTYGPVARALLAAANQCGSVLLIERTPGASLYRADLTADACLPAATPAP
jgi:hypothetical protein